MTLRDDIATCTFEVMAATDEEMSHPELMRASTRITNRILEMMRDAMLSDEAVEAMVEGLDAYEDHIHTVGSVEGVSQPSSDRAAASWAITAALDAVTE